ncbi:MAG TPA: metallophosphoesterase [Microlunatus sp.]|nr:metallophosphoesterase [Microlunatus sp.]
MAPAAERDRVDEDHRAEGPLLSFGVIADCQGAGPDAEPHPVRHYRLSEAKLAAAVAGFNSRDLAFVISLGDLIDRSARDLDPLLAVLATSRAPVRHCLGNHDLLGFDGDADAAVRGLAMPGPWYAWTERGVRFVVLDTNRLGVIDQPSDSPGRRDRMAALAARRAAGAINAEPWNGGVDPEQLAWLGEQLDLAAAAGQPAIVLAHQPVAPAGPLVALNATEIAAVLSRPGVEPLAYLNGHDHAGGLGWIGPTPDLTFVGMVDTTENAYAVVDVHPDRLVVTGFGREPSRVLTRRDPSDSRE